jgi:hypothetical protein
MPLNKAPHSPIYTIFFAGGTRSGTAQQLLESIRRGASKRSKNIAKLSTAQYASLLIDDAPFFLDKNLLAYLRQQPYASEFDRALRYLSEMEPSGVRILARQEA